ncbi:MAG: LPS export ABC transporter ATP-binding protein [Pseudomonadales bacterium]
MTVSSLQGLNLQKRYRDKVAVDDVSVAVERGEVIGLLGPNGAGKTTSFYLLVGLLKCDAGQVILNGEDLTEAPMHQRANAGLGYLPQEASVFRSLTTHDNLQAVLELQSDLSKSQQQQRLQQLLDEFNLNHIAGTLGQSLSGGERRRLEIARALASAPEFMLLDEPFAGVDPISVADIKNGILDLKNRGLGVLITDHNVKETLDICDRAYIVHEGHLIAAGEPEAILQDATVRQVYLGDNFAL